MGVQTPIWPTALESCRGYRPAVTATDRIANRGQGTVKGVGKGLVCRYPAPSRKGFLALVSRQLLQPKTPSSFPARQRLSFRPLSNCLSSPTEPLPEPTLDGRVPARLAAIPDGLGSPTGVGDEHSGDTGLQSKFWLS